MFSVSNVIGRFAELGAGDLNMDVLYSPKRMAFGEPNDRTLRSFAWHTNIVLLRSGVACSVQLQRTRPSSAPPQSFGAQDLRNNRELRPSLLHRCRLGPSFPTICCAHFIAILHRHDF